MENRARLDAALIRAGLLKQADIRDDPASGLGVLRVYFKGNPGTAEDNFFSSLRRQLMAGGNMPGEHYVFCRTGPPGLDRTFVMIIDLQG